MPLPVVALIFLAGLAIGSFLNVVAHRLPRGESLISPPSHCPKCDTPIRWYDNLPVLGWLLLRGRCRSCGESISWRYPAVELATGLLFGLVAATQDETIRIVLGLLLVTTLVPVTLIDLDTRRIPNAITLPSAIAALAAGLALDIDVVPEQLIAGAAAFAFFFIAASLYPRGMGMGDVKLAGVLGLYLGRAVAPAIFIALITGVVVGVVIIARVGQAAGRKTAVPFGPFLALGGIVAFFVGDDLVDAYVDRF
ncbi:MAG TPA: prepilin peptidase [Solirubrobacteraceae bacterium]|nr:prepilin peptidase [Solirubrobacteraceae bacterium]